MDETKDQPKRAVGYCRTSGEGQRDNTGIPVQREGITDFCQRQGWTLVRFYVDECKSGAKTEGRDDFNRMIQDASTGQFDVIVIHDLCRFARDGADVMATAKTLKQNFGVHVLDTKGTFDNRKHTNTMMNFTMAGMKEYERLTILQRTLSGRIQCAKDGAPWTRDRPIGRDFNRTGKRSGEWYITDRGKQLQELLSRYADGEQLRTLLREYGWRSGQGLTRAIREGQLSGQYHAVFNSPEIGIQNLRVPVPGIPPLIDPELEQRVRDRMAYNRVYNKSTKQKYLLSGFVRCAHCGHSLKGQTRKGHVYYRHILHETDTRIDCPFKGIRGDFLENAVLNYLFKFVFDEEEYGKAVKAALPTADDRQKVESDKQDIDRRLRQTKQGITNLAKAVAAGADPSLLIDEQERLKHERDTLAERLDELTEILDLMPDPEEVQRNAMTIRLLLLQDHQNRDWREVPYDDVRRFLHHLFGDNPRKHGFGIAVEMVDGQWHFTFTGQVKFDHELIDGKPHSHLLKRAAENASKDLKRVYETALKVSDLKHQTEVEQAKRTHEAAVKALEAHRGELKPDKVDVMTTGATIREAARALRGGGARRVYGAVIARAAVPRI